MHNSELNGERVTGKRPTHHVDEQINEFDAAQGWFQTRPLIKLQNKKRIDILGQAND